MWDAVKTEKFITFNVYIKWKEIFTINDQNLQLSKIKENKPRVSRRNQWNAKQIVELTKSISGSLRKINKIEKHLAKHVKK